MSIFGGFGAIPDRLADAEADGRSKHVGRLIGASASFPDRVDHSKHIDAVPNQGATNSCVGWFVSSAIYLAGQISGRPVPRPSAKWSYDVARYIDSPGLLIDAGCRPRSMMLGLARHGIVAESRVPFGGPATINQPPPFDADLAGADALFEDYYKVDGDVPTLLRMALAAGHVPGFAMAVHESFVELARGAVYDEPEGAELGRHMVTLVGYRPGAFLLLNSWSEHWADGGLCWISDRFVTSSYVSDRYVVTAAPIGR